MRIQHFSHQHQLVLGEQQSNENGGVRCSGCNEPVIGTAYSCTSCQFYLHKKCAHLPFTIHHSLHPQHVLTLLAKPPYPEGRYKCDMCHNAREGFLYHCSCCYFDLDINCAFIHPKITSQIDASRDNKIIPMASAKPIAFEGKAMEEKKHMQGGSPGILLQSIVQGYQSSSGSPDFGLFPFDWPISEEENIDKGEASKHAIPGEKSNFEPYQGKDIVEKEKKQQGQTKKSSCKNPSPIIFRTPFPKLEFQKPELVSIGPYHRDEEHPLDKYKHFFLEKYLSRTSNDPERNLCFYVGEIIALEKRARACYSEDFVMSSRDFVKMMLVDGCFTIELLLHFGGSEDYLFPKDPVSIIMPWQIPILVQDLLLLDNQIPFFVLEKLLDLFKNHEGKPEISLTTMALKFFDLAFPRSSNLISEFSPSKPNHLLDLFLMTIRPSNPRNSISHLLRPANRGNWTLDLLIQIRISDLMEAMSLATISTNREETENQALSQLEKSVAKLREAGIEFMPSRLNSFLDVNFKDGVIEIPIVTINKLFITLLVNAMVLECFSSNHSKPKPVTDYIYFMSCLIKEADDIKFLCSKGIISRFSYNNEKVAGIFILLRSYAATFIDRLSNSHLQKTMTALQSYNVKSRISLRQFLMETPVLFIMFYAISLLIICLFYLHYISAKVAQLMLALCQSTSLICTSLQRYRRQVLRIPAQEAVLNLFFTFLLYLFSFLE